MDGYEGARRYVESKVCPIGRVLISHVGGVLFSSPTDADPPTTTPSTQCQDSTQLFCTHPPPLLPHEESPNQYQADIATWCHSHIKVNLILWYARWK
jgi:hypothetical protein